MTKQDFIDKLLSDERGVIFACNTLDCLFSKVVDNSFVSSFLSASLVEAQLNPPTSYLALAAIISGVSMKSFIKKTSSYMLAANDKAALSSTQVTTVLSSNSFFHHLLSKDGQIFLPLAPKAGEEMKYAKKVELAAQKAGYLKPDATLGAQFGDKVFLAWITFFSSVPRPSHMFDATDVRNCIGLVQHGDGVHLVGVCFNESALASNGVKVARSTFADGGNERFRAKQDGTIVDPTWGKTLDLGKLDSCGGNSGVNLNGVEERVCEPIMLCTLSAKFSYHGKVTKDTTVTDEEYAQILMQKGGHTEDSIRSTLLTLM